MQQQLYKFRAPLFEGEALDRFEVIEDRGPRVLVRSVVFCLGWTIRPTAVYLVEDLEEVKP